MNADYAVTVGYGRLGDRLDAIYYFMRDKLGKVIRKALRQAEERGVCRVVRLRDLAVLRRERRRPGSQADRLLYLIEAEDIDGICGEIVNVKLRRGDELAQAPLPLCLPGDILFLRLRIYQRKVAIVPEAFTVNGIELNLRSGVLCQPEIYVIKPAELVAFELGVDQQVLRKYLWCFLRSDLALLQLLPLTIGGTRPRIRERDLLDLLLPLPPEDAMNEIVRSAERAPSTSKAHSSSSQPQLATYGGCSGPALPVEAQGSMS